MLLDKEDTKECAIHSLKTEIKGLQSIIDNSIDEKLVKFIELILKTKGRVFLSGIGKPGYIAHRVAATLSSTGTPSFFIHPSEASHGDLGMITKDDIMVLLSNSGGSVELNDIVAYCKRNNIPLVSITRKAESFISQSSDLPIVLTNVEQTNSINSPTTSEIMFLAYLDAVATCLIKIRGFNNDNFKNFHPGGKLGSALVKVKEIMRTTNLPLIYDDYSMSDALDTMIEKNMGCIGILSKETNNLIGIITDGDLKRKLKQYSNLMDYKVRDLMGTNPITIDVSKLAVDAVAKMSNGDKYIQVLFVVDENLNNDKTKTNVVGLIHIQDLFKAKII